MRLRQLPPMMRTRLRFAAVIVERNHTVKYSLPARSLQSLKTFLRKDLELTRDRWKKRDRRAARAPEDRRGALRSARGAAHRAPTWAWPPRRRSSRRCARRSATSAWRTRRAARGRAEGRAGRRSSRRSRSALPANPPSALRDPARGRERRGQDHDHRQAHAPLPVAGQVGAARRGRHVPRGRARAARRMGPAPQRRPWSRRRRAIRPR